jgi:hypothetical protein
MGIHDQQGDTPSTWVCLNMEDATLSGYFPNFFESDHQLWSTIILVVYFP